MTNLTAISHRAYAREDYQTVIDFLGTLLQLCPERHNWLPGRFEYAEFLVCPLFKERGLADWKESIHLWFDDQTLVAMVNSENPDANAYVQVRPDYEFLTEEIIAWAEENLAIDDWDNVNPRLAIWAHENDQKRQAILKKRGFRLTEQLDFLQRQRIADDITAPELPSGFQFSSFASGLNFDSRMKVTALAFGDETPLSESIYKVTRSAPSYREDFDLAIVNANHEAVTVATFWLDCSNQLAYIEPVATRPEHHGKGFAKKLLQYGMFLLKRQGIDKVYVGAHAQVRPFYKSCGFIEAQANQMWEKWYASES